MPPQFVAPASRRLSWGRPRLHTPNPPLIPKFLPPSYQAFHPAPCNPAARPTLQRFTAFSKKCLQYVRCSEKRYSSTSLRRSRRKSFNSSPPQSLLSHRSSPHPRTQSPPTTSLAASARSNSKL